MRAAKPQPVAAAPAPAPPPTAQPAPPPPATNEPPVPPQVNVVYFATGSSEITPDARTALLSIVEYLKSAPAEKVKLFAFVDPTGTTKRNKQLLVGRTKSVQQFFASSGVPEPRVEIPPTSIQTVPKNYPKDYYWKLRKVLVNYSSEALAVAQNHERQDDVASEEDAKPETPPPPRKKASSSKVASGNSPETSPSTDEEPKYEKLDVLYWRSTNHSLLLLAKYLGYFREEGFDVVLHEASNLEANQISVALGEGVGTVRAPAEATDIKKRKYFLGAVCPLGLHDALNKNIPLVQIGGMLENPNTLIVKKELAEKLKRNLSAFEGKTIARNRLNPSAVDYTDLFTNQLNARHIKYKEKLYGGFAETSEAVVRGEVDAALSVPPYDQMMVDKHPDTLAIYELRGLYSHLPCCRQLVMRSQLRDKKAREKYVKFEKALIRAHKYYRENKEETTRIVSKILRMQPSLVRSIFSRPGYDLDPNPNRKGSVAFYNTLKDHIGKQDINESVDTSVYEDALVSLAAANPNDEYFKAAIREYRLTN
jgi:NitT/TauT family transport system substrate-binding protein